MAQRDQTTVHCRSLSLIPKYYIYSIILTVSPQTACNEHQKQTGNDLFQECSHHAVPEPAARLNLTLFTASNSAWRLLWLSTRNLNGDERALTYVSSSLFVMFSFP
jgi:hypothetical protein